MSISKARKARFDTLRLSQQRAAATKEDVVRQSGASKRKISVGTISASLLRLITLGLVLSVLGGVIFVTRAHLTEQLLGAPKLAEGLIDPRARDGVFSPDNIERQILGLNLKLREQDLYIPVSDNARPRPFRVNLGEPARFVAARLQSDGFVNDGDLFNLYIRVNGLARRIEAGNFMLAETMTVPEVAEALQDALFEEAVVTIPEGFRAEEIAERLAEQSIIEPDQFMAAVRAPRSLTIFDDYEFLQALPEDGTLEGFLFPDTYRFAVATTSPDLIFASFLNNFEDKVGAEGLIGGTSGLSGRDLINLASIVEREAVQADERPIIASVYLNRINNACPDVGGNFLQADPTVQYARGVVGNWWWEPESIEEYSSVISPYNTYLNTGLPPGPIASPGLSAINATREPANTSYCFFVGTGEDGRHAFAQTFAEQEQNLRIYGYR